MCIDFEGHHFGGSSFVNENDFCYYRNCLCNHRYKFSSKKEPINESPSIKSRAPDSVRNPPLGSDREWGVTIHLHQYTLHHTSRNLHTMVS